MNSNGMVELTLDELDQVSGGGDVWNDIGKGALAGGFAGLVVTGTPMGFIGGAIGGGALAALWHHLN